MKPEDLALLPRGMLPHVPPKAPPGDLSYYWRLRDRVPADHPLQRTLAPLEHGQFAEETVRDNPLMALPLIFAIPGYTAGKATGLIRGTRSPASWDEIFEGYAGMLRGLRGQRP